MNRSELTAALAEKSRITPEEARRVIDIVFDAMKDAMKEGGRIEIRGFGSFFVKDYRPYRGRNPRSGESVEVRPKRLPFFKCGKELRDMLNSGEEKNTPPASSHVVIRGGACPAYSFVNGLFPKDR